MSVARANHAGKYAATLMLPFELHHLEAFVAVVEEHSVSLAAKRLFITQPALSRKIQTLEQALGLRLFERGHNRIEITEAGRRLYVDASYIIQLVNMAVDRARGVALRAG